MAHDHAHGDEPAQEEDTRIRVLHGASPFCWWSWGYEPVLNRLRLVYGDQIKVNTYQVPVYEDRDEHHRSYGTDDPKVRKEWVDEAAALMRIPLDLGTLAAEPRSCVPGTLVCHAAEIVKPGAGERFARLVGYHLHMEHAGVDFDDDDALLKLAERAGAPAKAVEAAIEDGRAEASLREDAQAYHMLRLNFYALQVRDAEGRTVTIDNAFDAAKVEEAVDWLSRGALRKRAVPQDLAGYVAAHAPLTLREVTEVFRVDAAKALAAGQQAEKAGKVARRDVRGMACWVPR